MKYRYQAFDQAGERKSGVVEASTQDEATESLARRGLYVVEIAEDGKARTEEPRKAPRRSSKASPKQIANFAREMSVLISTGTPIADAVESLEAQAPNEDWRGIVSSVRRGLEEGESLSASLDRRRDVFDAVFVSLVAAGESSGQLDTMLHRVAILTRRSAQVRSNLIGALMYPVLLTLICVGVLGLMLGVVLPRFSGLFETLDTPLPGTTRMLVALSNAMIGGWFVWIPAALGTLAVGTWWARSPAGCRAVGDALLGVPKVGEIVRSFGTAQVTRLLGTLLGAKVPMLEAIELTRRAIGHHRFIELLNNMEQSVIRGDAISVVLLKSSVFNPSAAQAIRNGEQTGRLPEVLTHIADYLDEENQSTVKSLSSLLEPMIMLVLGGLVAFVAVSMFLPLFDLTASAGGK